MSQAEAAAPERIAGSTAPEATTPWRETVLLLIAVLTPPLAYLNSVGFSVLIALGGILVAPVALRGRRPMLGLAYLALLAAWALISMGWSIYGQSIDLKAVSPEDITAAKMFLELGLYGAFASAALGLSAPSARRASLGLAIGVAALAALFMVEGLLHARLYYWIRAAVGQPTGPDFAIRDVGRVAYFIAMLFWPAAVRMHLMRAGKLPLTAVAVAIGVSAVAGATLLGVDAPTAALLVSAGVFALVLWLGRPAVWICLAAVVAYFALTPLLVTTLWPAGVEKALGSDPARLSWAIRLDIWRFAAERILERPLVGWGLDASRAMSPGIQLHPHNGALQLWLELGAVGAALAALFWGWVFGRIDRLEARDRLSAAASAATAAAYLTIGALSFGIWQEWWIALGVLAAAGCIMLARFRAASLPPEPVEPEVEEPGLPA